MRLTMLAMALGSMIAFPLQAQQADPQSASAPPPVIATQAMPADGIRTEATVVVTGEQPGPGLWLVALLARASGLSRGLACVRTPLGTRPPS